MSRNKPAKHHGKKKYQRKKQTPRTWWLYGLLAAAAVVVVFVIIGIVKGTDSSKSAIQPVTPQQAHEKYLEGAYILDVREQEEYDEYHIPGATLIPLGELNQRIGEVPRDREVVVVCRSGNRSSQGASILVNAGYDNVSNMTGGMKQWRSLGYEVDD